MKAEILFLIHEGGRQYKVTNGKLISNVKDIYSYIALYNAKLSKTPTLYKEYSQAGIGNNRMFGVLLCMKQILKSDKHWNLYVDQIEMLIDKYEKVDVKTMGFPQNWKELLEQK